MQNERLHYLDLGAGVMILYMIIGHAFQAQIAMEVYGVAHGFVWPGLNMNHIQMSSGHPYAAYRDVLFPYLHFYMAWFFYKSGQLFSKRSCIDLFRKDSDKLLRFFVVGSAVGYVLYVSLMAMRGMLTFRAATLGVLKTFILHGNMPLNYPLWFLFTLFIVRQIANVVLPDRNSKFFFPLSALVVCITYILSYILWRNHCMWMPYYVANTVVGLMFFSLGYSLSKYETKRWLYIPAILGYIGCCVWGFSVVQYYPNTLEAGNYLLNMPTALCGIVTFNILCRFLVKYVPKILIPFEIVAQNAMIIYVAHGLLYVPIAYVILNFNMTNVMPYAFFLIIASYCVALPWVCVLYSRIKI